MCEAWLKYAKYENSYVEVITSEGDPISGYLYTCDPETGNIGILGSGTTAHLIFSAEVTNVLPAGDLPDGVSTSLPAPKHTHSSTLNKDVVLRALHQRRIMAEAKRDDDGEYIAVMNGIAVIRSPFMTDSCRSTSETVLIRLRQVLSEIYGAHSNGN